MSQMIVGSRQETSSPLRRVLIANACTSLVSGLAAVIARGAVADVLGLDGARAELIILLVGVGLVVFAVDVAFTALRTRDDTLARNVGLISVGDIAWVIATAVVLATVDLSRAGQLIAVAMGLCVAVFAALQLRLR